MYIGRFAPSPTGDLHFGSLIAAVASYLQAASQQGHWKLRIDDIDATRTIKGSDTHIIKTLEAYGFEWQGNIYYQSKNIALYEQALQQLIQLSLVFPCSCSRKSLAEQDQLTDKAIYPGICRNNELPKSDKPEPAEHALRLLAENCSITFCDKVMGPQQQNIQHDCGDFIIKRRDGLFAYQLAVVIDDAIQGVTEVVRGVDLLDSTPRQIYLQQILGYTRPGYLHLPLAVNQLQQKFSKSAGAASIENIAPAKNLVHALNFLGQKTPDDLDQCELTDIWFWAKQHWRPAAIPTERMQVVE